MIFLGSVNNHSDLKFLSTTKSLGIKSQLSYNLLNGSYRSCWGSFLRLIQGCWLLGARETWSLHFPPTPRREMLNPNRNVTTKL